MKGYKNFDGINENSKHQYLFYLKKINSGDLPKNINFYKDFEGIKEKIKDYKPNTKLFIINTIIKLLSNYKSYVYIKLLNNYKKYRDTELITEKNNYLETEKSNNEVQNINIDINKISNPLERFITALYILQVPRRAMDYYAMEIIDTESKIPENPIMNYLCENEKLFYFSKYKTSSKYGIQKVNINDELWNEYLKYKNYRKDINNRLLQKSDGSSIDNNQTIQYYLNKVFGKGKSINFLRHLYVQEKLGEFHKNISENAYKMGHSPQMSIYYNQYKA